MEDRLVEAQKKVKLALSSTASAKTAVKNNARTLLRESVAATQMFLATNPVVAEWTTARILGNNANSIAAGLDDDEPIPLGDVEEYQNNLLDFSGRWDDYNAAQDDLDSEHEEAKQRIVVKKKSANAKLAANVTTMGLKALALVKDDIVEIFNSDDIENDAATIRENESKIATASKHRGFRSKADASIKDDEYRQIENQLDRVSPYIEKMRQQLPRRLTERFVLLKQPVIIVGKVKYSPSREALSHAATHGVDLGGYWMLKNQIVLGVANNPAKLAKDPDFRKSVEDRLRTVYEEDLRKRLLKSGNKTRNAESALRKDVERYVREDLDDEIQSLLMSTNVNELVKLISSRLGYQVVSMDGISRVNGSPYTYYWLVSDDVKDRVIDGLYSEVNGWDLPYK